MMKRSDYAKTLIDGLLGLCLLVALFYTGGQLLKSRQIAAAASDDTESTRGTKNIESRNLVLDLPAQRDAVAKVAIVEFADFQCPYCSKYAHEVLPRIKSEYVKDGRVEYIFRHYPLTSIHPAAARAASIAYCAGEQGEFWKAHESLFDTIAIVGLPDSRLSRTLKLDSPKFANCMNGAPFALRADIVDATKMGVAVTPTFFIGRVVNKNRFEAVTRINGAAAFEDFRPTLDSLLNDQ